MLPYACNVLTSSATSPFGVVLTHRIYSPPNVTTVHPAVERKYLS